VGPAERRRQVDARFQLLLFIDSGHPFSPSPPAEFLQRMIHDSRIAIRQLQVLVADGPGNLFGGLPDLGGPTLAESV
jgi:hypothetical protein